MNSQPTLVRISQVTNLCSKCNASQVVKPKAKETI